MPDEGFCPHCGGPLSAPPAPKMFTPNMEARAQGFLDGCANIIDDSRWPPGQEGQADYHLGWREGELHRG